MPKKTWTLTDQRHHLEVDHLSLDPMLVGGKATGYTVTKRTLQSGRSRGVDIVEVDNGRMRFVILPTRGMGLWRAAVGGLKLGWESPVQGPVLPSLVPIGHPSGLGWLEGFDELLCRCGLESNGAPEFDDQGRLRYGLHGRIANLPAHEVDVTIDSDAGEIAVRGVVDESRLFGNKMRLDSTISTRVGEPRITVTDTVTNFSAEPGELELVYHINFGVPLLEPDGRVHLPLGRLCPVTAVAQEDLATWNTYGPEWPGSIESGFFVEPAAADDGSTLAVLQNKAGSRGVAVRFNTRNLPRFTLWKNRQSAADGYVTGLEPGVNFPNPKSFEKQHGRVVELQPGESRTFEVTIEALVDAAAVKAAAAEVARVQESHQPDIVDRPDPDWSASG